MIVQNINGTSDNDCNCGGWLKHWQKFSGQVVGACSESSCLLPAEVGAHVQSGSLLGNNDWYILPMCQRHNMRAAKMKIKEGIKPVSANKSKTCEYKGLLGRP